MNSPGPDNTPREYPNGSDFARKYKRPDPTPQVDPYPDGIPPIRAGAVQRFLGSGRFRAMVRLALKLAAARLGLPAVTSDGRIEENPQPTEKKRKP